MAKNRETTITLSDDDLHDAVDQWAERNGLTKQSIESIVKIRVIRRSMGYGSAERDETYAEVSLTVKS